MADQQSEVGLILGLESGPLQRELAKVSNALKGMEKLLNPKSTEKLFKREAIDKYIGGVVELNKELAKTVAMHREIAKIAGSLGGGGGARGGGGGGGPAGGGGKSGGSGPSRMRQMISGAGTPLRWAFDQANAGLQTLTEQQFARMQTVALAGRRPSARDIYKTERFGESLGFRRQQTQQLLRSSILARGEVGPGDIRSNLAMVRGRNLDPGSLFAMQGAARHAGSDQAAKEINKALIQAVKMGGFEDAFTGELARSITGLMASTMRASEGTKPGQVGGLLATMSSSLGGVYQRSPRRSAQLLSGLHGTISGGGAGDASQAFLLRAMGYGSGSSYVESLERAERGIRDPANVKRVLDQVKREYSGTENQMLALHRLSGGQIKLHESRRLLGMDTSSLTAEGIQGAMASQQTNIIGRGKQAGKQIGLTRMNIAKEQKRAQVAQAALPAINTAFDAQLASMQLAIIGFGKAAPAINDFRKNIQSLNKESKELGGVFGMLKAAGKGAYMSMKESVLGASSVYGTPTTIRKNTAGKPRK